MEATDRLKQTAGFRMEEMDGELLLLNPASAKILYCNQTAWLIWALCTGEHTLGEMVASLIEAYPAAAQAIEADLRSTLDAFLEAGAIQAV